MNVHVPVYNPYHCLYVRIWIVSVSVSYDTGARLVQLVTRFSYSSYRL